MLCSAVMPVGLRPHNEKEEEEEEDCPTASPRSLGISRCVFVNELAAQDPKQSTYATLQLQTTAFEMC